MQIIHDGSHGFTNFGKIAKVPATFIKCKLNTTGCELFFLLNFTFDPGFGSRFGNIHDKTISG